MVRETGVMKLSELMLNLYDIYPDLKDKGYIRIYGSGVNFNDESIKKKFLGARAKEIEKTTDAIISFIDMGLIVYDSDGSRNRYFRKLITYYMVLMDAVKYNLDFKTAYDDIFDSPTIGKFE